MQLGKQLLSLLFLPLLLLIDWATLSLNFKTGSVCHPGDGGTHQAHTATGAVHPELNVST